MYDSITSGSYFVWVSSVNQPLDWGDRGILNRSLTSESTLYSEATKRWDVLGQRERGTEAESVHMVDNVLLEEMSERLWLNHRGSGWGLEGTRERGVG